MSNVHTGHFYCLLKQKSSFNGGKPLCSIDFVLGFIKLSPHQLTSAAITLFRTDWWANLQDRQRESSHSVKWKRHTFEFALTPPKLQRPTSVWGMWLVKLKTHLFWRWAIFRKPYKNKYSWFDEVTSGKGLNLLLLETRLQDTHNRTAECIHSAQIFPLTGPLTSAGLITPAEFWDCTFSRRCTKGKACWSMKRIRGQRVHGRRWASGTIMLSNVKML